MHNTNVHQSSFSYFYTIRSTTTTSTPSTRYFTTMRFTQSVGIAMALVGGSLGTITSPLGFETCGNTLGGPCTADGLLALANDLYSRGQGNSNGFETNADHPQQDTVASDGSGCTFRFNTISCSGSATTPSMTFTDASTFTSNTCNKCGVNGGTCINDGFASQGAALGGCGAIQVGTF